MHMAQPACSRCMFLKLHGVTGVPKNSTVPDGVIGMSASKRLNINEARIELIDKLICYGINHFRVVASNNSIVSAWYNDGLFFIERNNARLV